MKKIIKRKIKKQPKRQKKSGVNVNVNIDLRKTSRISRRTTQPKAQSISYIPWTATQYNPNILSDIRESVKSDLANVQKQTQQSQQDLITYIEKSLSQRDGKLDDKDQTSSFLLKDVPELSEFEKNYGIKEELLRNPQWQQKALSYLGINKSKPVPKPSKIVDIDENTYPPISPFAPSKLVDRLPSIEDSSYPPISPIAPKDPGNIPPFAKKKPGLDTYKGIQGNIKLKNLYKQKFNKPAPKKSSTVDLYNTIYNTPQK